MQHLKGLTITLFTSCSACAVAQNLVPNPGFEYYNSCPAQRSNIAFSPAYNNFPTARDWVSPINTTTPDYYNACATSPLVTVPYNTYNGYRETHSGNAYMGISMFSGRPKQLQKDDYREYLETKLSSPLQAGHQYYVSFFVNLTYHLPDEFNIIAVDKIGLRFSEEQIDTVIDPFAGRFLLQGKPDIVMQTGFITDSAKWVKVYGIYTAHGGEQWATIGRFDDGGPLNYKLVYSPVNDIDSIHCTCYMYVDDVCVRDMEEKESSDTLIYSSVFPMVVGDSTVSGEYLWNTGYKGPLLTIQKEGTYWKQSWGDCSYRIDTVRVKKTELSECLWLPNAFTPNKDGRNDMFGPVDHCYTHFYFYRFSIYNRWGQEIFETDNPLDKWNGNWRGVQQDAGTYFYLLQYTLTASPGRQLLSAANKDIHIIKGDLTLLK